MKPDAAPSRKSSRLLQLVDRSGSSGDTKTRILNAAFRRLNDEGYAALSLREIAKDAGVNHALINYHFRSKEQLVVAVLDEANRQLLDRQQRMYASDSGFAAKWAEARRFYREDLASGFVRVQSELLAAAMSQPELRQQVMPRVLAWKRMVLGGVTDAFEALERAGTPLPPPFTPRVLATWIAEFWLGMEFAELVGEGRERASHEAALDAMQELLEIVDARGAAPAAPPARAKKRK